MGPISPICASPQNFRASQDSQFPTVRSPLRPLALSPLRLYLKRHRCMLGLIERMTISPVFQLVQDAIRQFSGLGP